MQIDINDRAVTLSVRELAQFRQLNQEQRFFGPTNARALVGQEWHKVSEENTRSRHPDAIFEYSLNTIWIEDGWTYKIQGRIDQIIPFDQGAQVREIKTVQKQLPATVESLRDAYPEYFTQAAIYAELIKVMPDYANHRILAELHFIDIQTGTVQSIDISTETEALFQKQLNTLGRFLEFRRTCAHQLQSAQLHPAFENLREGQEALFTQLAEANLRTQTVLLEAPTGFGKTGIVLEHALKHMQSGHYERCIYLTSKSTGQIETIRQIEHMLGGNVRYLQMRNREEHRIESARHTCQADGACDSMYSSDQVDMDPAELLQGGTLSLSEAKKMGEAFGICPYELSKSCLPYSEIWIGDVNYVFSPESRSVFLDASGLDPTKTLLIIDEAHNLPDRVASSLSVRIGSGDLIFALEELRAAGAPRRLISIGQELARFIDAQPDDTELDTNKAYEALDLCEDFTRQLKEAHYDYEALPDFARKIIWEIPDLADRLDSPAHQWLIWSAKGQLQATCLDPSDWIRQTLTPFGSRILMSATLSPMNAFAASCGLQPEQYVPCVGEAPWRDHAYSCAIDTRIDTRLRLRQQYYEATAQTVAQLIQANPGEAIATFFASYQYAENIKAYLEALHPEFRIMIQPRGVDLAEQTSFIESGLLMADALFLILGSSYAEGVDQLGGRISNVMIVGPALPEVNAIQNAKMDKHPGMQRDEAFRDVYIRPAMRRIHQALGRIVRAPEHRAKVLLHDRRFHQPEYFSQLAPEYSDATIIRNDHDLLNWIIE